MNNQTIGYLSTFCGSKIIVSKHCYITKTVVYGIADKRRPNNKKPLYRKKTIRIPTAYIVNGDLVCHPAWEAAMRKKIAEGMTAAIDNMTRHVFLSGAGEEPVEPKAEGPSPVSACWADLMKALNTEILLPQRRTLFERSSPIFWNTHGFPDA